MDRLDKKIERLIKRAKKLHDKLEANRLLYKEKEAVVGEILELGVKEFEMENFKMEVIDQFAGKNTKFKPAAFNRFELAFSALEESNG